MPMQVRDETKESRSHRLIALRDELSVDYRKRYIGKTRPVLFEEETVIDKKRYITGHTPEYIRVAVEPGDIRPNDIRDVKLKGFIGDDIMTGII